MFEHNITKYIIENVTGQDKVVQKLYDKNKMQEILTLTICPKENVKSVFAILKIFNVTEDEYSYYDSSCDLYQGLNLKDSIDNIEKCYIQNISDNLSHGYYELSHKFDNTDDGDDILIEGLNPFFNITFEDAINLLIQNHIKQSISYAMDAITNYNQNSDLCNTIDEIANVKININNFANQYIVNN